MRNHLDIEERLRTAFRAVADSPGPPAASGSPARQGRPKFLRSGSHPRLLVVVATIAAVAAIVAIVVAYGPRNGGKPVSPSPVPVTQPPPNSSSTSLPPRTSTTLPLVTTLVPAIALGTQQITYEPFTGSTVDRSLHVTGQQSGACYEFGGGVYGRIYYRCIGTPDVMQPCFAGPQGTSAHLVCPDGPVTSNDVTLWTVTMVDTTGFIPATVKSPWAMQLSNGMVCELVNAAWGGLGPYGCSTPGSTTPADCRAPEPSATYWTAECQDQLTDTSPFRAMTVEKVWF